MRPYLCQGLGQGPSKNPGGTAGSQNLASKATIPAHPREPPDPHCHCHRHLLSGFSRLTEETMGQCPRQESCGFKELNGSNHKRVYYRKSASCASRPRANWEVSRQSPPASLRPHRLSPLTDIPSLQTSCRAH